MENTENKFNYNGLWYVAVEQDGCRNCAFSDGKKCFANDETVPACNEFERKDNRNVIFVESDADNFGGEE